MGLDCPGGIVRHVAEPSARPACRFVWERKKGRNKKESKTKTLKKKKKKSKLDFWVDFVTLCSCGITHGHQGPGGLKAVNQPVVFTKPPRCLCPLPKAELLQRVMPRLSQTRRGGQAFKSGQAGCRGGALSEPSLEPSPSKPRQGPPECRAGSCCSQEPLEQVLGCVGPHRIPQQSPIPLSLLDCFWHWWLWSIRTAWRYLETKVINKMVQDTISQQDDI